MAEHKDYSGMFDWKDSVVVLNSITQRLLWPFVPVMPVDKKSLALIEKAFLESQQQFIQGLLDVIGHRLSTVNAETKKIEKITVA